jgi:hypothetical protein
VTPNRDANLSELSHPLGTVPRDAALSGVPLPQGAPGSVAGARVHSLHPGGGSAELCFADVAHEGAQPARRTAPPFGRSGPIRTSGSDDLGLEHGIPALVGLSLLPFLALDPARRVADGR